jgi:hypothetical protein
MTNVKVDDLGVFIVKAVAIFENHSKYILVLLDVLEGRHKKAQRRVRHGFSKVFPKRPPPWEILLKKLVKRAFVPFFVPIH